MSWFFAAAVFVSLQLLVAMVLALSVGFQDPPPFGRYGNIAIAPVVLYLSGLALWRLRSLPENPARYLARQDWSDCRNFALAMLLVCLQFLCLTWMKAMIPHVTPMWADAPLAKLERAILGQDAWRLLPDPDAFIDSAYAAWLLVTYAAFVAVYFVRSERRSPLLLAFFLTVGLVGTFGQYLLPSGGPIFFERLGFGDRFSAMAIPELAARTSDYLWSAYSEGGVAVGTGISAFPSVHVATTAWVAIAFRHPIAYTWLALIFAGSIMLGWHYALDGIAGAIGALICYRLAKLILNFGAKPNYSRREQLSAGKSVQD